MVETVEEQTPKIRVLKPFTIKRAKLAGFELMNLIETNQLALKGTEKLPVKFDWDNMIRLCNSNLDPEDYLDDNSLVSDALEIITEVVKSNFLGNSSNKT